MNKFACILLLSSLCLAINNGYGQPLPDYDRLLKAFTAPPPSAHPKTYWWWLNGYTDTARLMQELAAMKTAGIAGVDIFDIGARAPNNPDKMIPAGPPFMGPQALATLVKVIKKATEYNMEVGLSLSSSWNAGGSWVTPLYAGKSLYHSSVVVEGGSSKTITVPFPEISPLDERGKPRVIVYNDEGRPVYSKEVAVLAYPAGSNGFSDTSSIINLSAAFDPVTDQLSWKFPVGQWKIQRFVCSSSGEQLKYYSDSSAGPIIDHFDSAATRFHFMYFIDHLRPLLGDFRKTALKSLYLASFEATGSVWTPALPETFKKISGYDVYKFLPAVFSDSLFNPAVRGQFLHDYNKTISELMIRNHYGKGKEIANSYGLQLISESGGPGPPLHNVPVEGLKALGALDVPRGEFWNKHKIYDADSIDLLMLVKEVSAAAHMYHRKIIEEESFTSFQHWTDGPFELKPLGDRAFCEGMNRVVLHGFSHNPARYGYPGIVYHAGTHFSDKNTWWPGIKPFFDYLARISAVMQETQFVSDVLYYYGDQVPNFVTPKNTRFTAGKGYDYDIINTDVLLRELAVRDGKLVLPGGASFYVLTLGDMSLANPAVVKKLAMLAAQGAHITGGRPVGAIGLQGQPERTASLLQTSKALWAAEGAIPSTKGKIIPGGAALPLLQALGVKPDFEHPGTSLDYIHQRSGNIDIYLVRNATEKWVTEPCAFRQEGKVPELWDAARNEVVPVGIYRQDRGRLYMPVSLAPFESAIFVFRPKSGGSHLSGITGAAGLPRFRYTAAGVELLDNRPFTLETGGGKRAVQAQYQPEPIKGSWQVTFTKGRGAPDSAVFSALSSWTTNAHNGIKYFSGTASYHKNFDYQKQGLSSSERVYLDLGDLDKLGHVWLNGQSLGIAWAKPYRFDITSLLKDGANALRIDITNGWANRIIGDALTGGKFTSTNLAISTTGVPWNKSPLVASGLLGPVTIERVQTITID